MSHVTGGEITIYRIEVLSPVLFRDQLNRQGIINSLLSK